MHNLSAYGVFIPGIAQGVSIRACAAHNIDTMVDSYDGKNSFHGIAMCVYQPICHDDTMVESISLCQVSSGSGTTVLKCYHQHL